MEQRIVHCFCCENELEVDCDTIVNDGGWMNIDFGYGSKFDYDRNASLGAEDEVGKLLQCNEVRAYICDECFERKFKLCEGYDTSLPERYRVL